MSPFSLIENLINEHGSSSILRERLLLIKEELSKVEKERTELQAKMADLVKENSELRKQLEQINIPNQFTEYLGVLFKFNSSGQYTPLAYCPVCRNPLWNNEPKIFPYQCSIPSCGYTIMIHEDLISIIDRLNNGTKK